MEDKLDAIARGEKGRVEYLSEYYLGEEGLRAKVASKSEVIDPVEAKRARLPGLEVRHEIDSSTVLKARVPSKMEYGMRKGIRCR